MSTPLSQALYRGHIKCIKELLPHKPDTSLKRYDSLHIESLFKADRVEVLEFLLYDPKMQKYVNGDPNMTVTNENIDRLLQ